MPFSFGARECPVRGHRLVLVLVEGKLAWVCPLCGAVCCPHCGAP